MACWKSKWPAEFQNWLLCHGFYPNGLLDIQMACWVSELVVLSGILPRWPAGHPNGLLSFRISCLDFLFILLSVDLRWPAGIWMACWVSECCFETFWVKWPASKMACCLTIALMPCIRPCLMMEHSWNQCFQSCEIKVFKAISPFDSWGRRMDTDFLWRCEDTSKKWQKRKCLPRVGIWHVFTQSAHFWRYLAQIKSNFLEIQVF